MPHARPLGVVFVALLAACGRSAPLGVERTAVPPPSIPQATLPPVLQAPPVVQASSLVQAPSAWQRSPAPTPPPLAPTPSPAPSPSFPIPPRADPAWDAGDLIPFEARPRPDQRQRDLYVYNARLDTVVAFVAANSPADEATPKLSRDRRWLLFRRHVSQPDRPDNQDLLLFDLEAQLLRRLPGLESPQVDEREPAISGDGRYVLYTASPGGGSRLQLYDVWTQTRFELPAANADVAIVAGVALSDDARTIGFSARLRRPDGTPGDLDIFLYDVATGVRWSPPFVNSPADEDDPDLAADGTRMVFSSNRRGRFGLYAVDWAAGLLDDLPLAATPLADALSPKFYGKGGARIRYKLHPDLGTSPDDYVLRVYDPATHAIDMLPVANDGLLRAGELDD